jgi:Zn-dependent protease with chaperone function
MSEAGKAAIDPNLRRTAKWIALILFILYCADLVWKLAHWSQYSAGLKISTIVLALAFRFVFMAFLLWMYLRARRLS